MFTALNITGIARVELCARNQADLMNEAQTIFNAICNARHNVSDEFDTFEAAVTSGHKIICRISRPRGSSRSRLYGFTDLFRSLPVEPAS